MKPGDTYTAMVYPSPGAALVAQRRVVPAPGPGELVVRLRGSALNYHDVMVAGGALQGVLFPRVPICDGCGEVIAAGADTAPFAVGDRVVPAVMPLWQAGPETAAASRIIRGDQIDGCLAQVAVFSAATVARAPSHLDDVEAATLCGAGITAWRAIAVEADVQPGQVVVLQGTGGVALYGLQLAKQRGAIAIVTSSSDAKLERARALGADHVINYRREPQWGEAVKALTGGEGAHLVLDVAGTATFGQSLIAARFGGRVILVGGVGGFDPAPLSFFEVISRNLSIKGITAGSRADLDALCRAFEAGRLRPVVDVRIAMAEVEAGIARLARGEHIGKIGIVIE
ncbi:MAG: NAD(P)-dependent alcohol dehydrogenase [Gammaproteobacteria bacterium]